MEHVIVLSIALMMMMTHEAVALKRHSQADVFPSLRRNQNLTHKPNGKCSQYESHGRP